MSSPRVITLGSLIGVVLLALMLRWNADVPVKSVSRGGGDGAKAEPLLLYCAAGLKPVVESVIREYEAASGHRVQVQYGGSGTLLSNLKVARVGDLFLAADDSYLDIARSNRLVVEVIPLARMKPVIAVAKGNPKNIRNLGDLMRTDVHLVLPNPDAAAIGKTVRGALTREGRWEGFAARALAFKPTVNDLANDLKLGSADATFLWDATVRQYPEMEAVEGEAFGGVASEVGVGILESSKQPREALRFARYLGAPDRGGKSFVGQGFLLAEGDAWVEVPELLLYSGGVNRLAIEETLRKFEDREGVRITRVYNGCGILTAQIRSGQRPDGYFACDVSFMKTVKDEFRPSVELAETRMMIATKKGNPMGLNRLEDLGRSGVKLGVANEQQSALGALTTRLLRRHGLYDVVMSNVVVQTPTADLLVNQLRTGSLDAVVVYEANTVGSAGQIGAEPIELEGATAVQPIAVARSTRYPQLMGRLLGALRSVESEARFTTQGFRWRDRREP